MNQTQAPPDKNSVGDALQSSASRLAEFVEGLMRRGDGHNVPYEVRLAVFEAKSCVNTWTSLRKLDK